MHSVPLCVIWSAMFFGVWVEVRPSAHAAISEVTELVNVESVLSVFKSAELSLHVYRSAFRCLNDGVVFRVDGSMHSIYLCEGNGTGYRTFEFCNRLHFLQQDAYTSRIK